MSYAGKLKYQQGISLTELLISLFLSCLLMSALMQHYLCVKRQYTRTQHALEQVLELQLVSELLRDSVRAAGFTPCLGVEHLITRDRRNEQANLTSIAIDSMPSTLKIARMNDDFLPIIRQVSPTQLLLNGQHAVDVRYPVVIADCFHAEVQTVSRSEKTSAGLLVTLKKPLFYHYFSPFYFGEWLEEQFYIAKNHRGESALFYGTTRREELTTHVNYLSARLSKFKGATLVAVTLGVVDASSILLETRVRTP